jgi:hypothetical protein
MGALRQKPTMKKHINVWFGERGIYKIPSELEKIGRKPDKRTKLYKQLAKWAASQEEEKKQTGWCSNECA